jgi:hypothetical protein
MPLQNCVLPTGEIVAHPVRGLLTASAAAFTAPTGRSKLRHTHSPMICA